MPECPICYNESHTDLMWFTSCGHGLCWECTGKLFVAIYVGDVQPVCPMCRSSPQWLRVQPEHSRYNLRMTSARKTMVAPVLVSKLSGDTAEWNARLSRAQLYMDVE